MCFIAVRDTRPLSTTFSCVGFSTLNAAIPMVFSSLMSRVLDVSAFVVSVLMVVANSMCSPLTAANPSYALTTVGTALRNKHTAYKIQMIEVKVNAVVSVAKFFDVDWDASLVARSKEPGA